MTAGTLIDFVVTIHVKCVLTRFDYTLVINGNPLSNCAAELTYTFYIKLDVNTLNYQQRIA